MGTGKAGRLILGVLAVLASGVQFPLPDFGFFGRSFEALKAIALYINDVPGAAAMYAGDLALMFSILLAAVSYAFTGRNVATNSLKFIFVIERKAEERYFS